MLLVLVLGCHRYYMCRDRVKGGPRRCQGSCWQLLVRRVRVPLQRNPLGHQVQHHWVVGPLRLGKPRMRDRDSDSDGNADDDEGGRGGASEQMVIRTDAAILSGFIYRSQLM